MSVTVVHFQMTLRCYPFLQAKMARQADGDRALQVAMVACAKQHMQLMDKPELQNLRDCWKAHGHLMQSS